jgi:hypothetical protein
MPGTSEDSAVSSVQSRIMPWVSVMSGSGSREALTVAVRVAASAFDKVL